MNQEYKTLNVYQKLSILKDSVKGFYKDGESDGGKKKIKYVSGSQVLSRINPIMNELGLIFVPVKVKHRDFQQVTLKSQNGERLNFIVQAEVIYEWVNTENPKDKIVVEFELYGQQDEASKAFGSGLTYTERYMLLKSLGLPTDEEDPDKKPIEDDYKEEPKLTQAQLSTIKQLFKESQLTALASRYKVKTVEDLSVSQASDAITKMKQAQAQS